MLGWSGLRRPVALEVDVVERPAGDARLGGVGQVDLPLQPERHPGLRPGRDPDRIGVGALEERETAQLVADPAPIKCT